ncbi:hypothetical protein [Erythrobacter aurantius]|uniref:hypothetical protein n=1 Tax=Erythrobacter aurantius TaxID=2909249 RepID=UPI00207A5FF8|nr:hypothetical protein [Erythrobacter aurantius]
MQFERSKLELEALEAQANRLPQRITEPRQLRSKLDELGKHGVKPVDQAVRLLTQFSDTLDRYTQHKLGSDEARKPSGGYILARPPAEPSKAGQSWQELAREKGRKLARSALMYTSRGLRAFVNWLQR